jgi:hypothetical protein
VVDVSPQVEAERHAGLHVGDRNPARIIALTGDVSQGGITEANASQQPAPNFGSGYENIAKASEIYAGRDIVDLAQPGKCRREPIFRRERQRHRRRCPGLRLSAEPFAGGAEHPAQPHLLRPGT